MSIGTKLKQLFLVRKVDLEKEPEKLEWLRANKERNDFDEAVIGYPSTVVLSALDHVVMPVQTVAMLESIGNNPASGVRDTTAGLIELVKAAATLAHVGGIRELYFLSSDENTGLAAKQMGFVEVPLKVMRLRLPE